MAAGHNNQFYIPFCYKNAAVKSKTEAVLGQAIEIWYEALGGRASKESGHGVVFKEAFIGGHSVFCETEGGAWNDNLKYDILLISYQGGPEAGFGATVWLDEVRPTTTIADDDDYGQCL